MPAIELELPDGWQAGRDQKTIADYNDLDALVYSFYERSESLWLDAMRWLCANDLFWLVSRVLTFARVKNEATGAPIFNRKFILDRCREIQTEIHMVADLWARGTGKSTCKTLAHNIQRAINQPDSSGFIWSYDKLAAQVHLSAWMEEIEKNIVLKRVYPDVFWWDPQKEAPARHWSIDHGASVKRKASRKERTLEAHGLKMDGLPTGRHPEEHHIDDAEEKRRLRTEESTQDLHEAFRHSATIKSGLWFKRTFTGTPHGALGVIAGILNNPDWTVRFHPGEDRSLPGPGPMGGTPCGYYEGATAELWQWYAMFDRRASVYCEQICLDVMAGQTRTMPVEHIGRYSDPPEVVGRDAYVYICGDFASGKDTANRTDPAAFWVWGLRPDRRFYWLDGELRKMPPSERHEVLYELLVKWERISLGVVQVRLEEFGAAEYVSRAEEYLLGRDYFDVQIVPCHDNRKSKLERAWGRWEPPMRDDRLRFPRSMLRRDHDGQNRDLVHLFMEGTLKKFPHVLDDNLMDAGALVWEDEQNELYGRLQFPEPGAQEQASTVAASRPGSIMSEGLI